ncbi:UDP-glycosyltransferase 73C4-like [Alnus glutinosa]|uniref:UDP-glycosyltransferase 73C4-like n=1 Tax=Alnus glutinosa TaxID=3517 RepID=UPI002D787AAF|nr:UDP-glycosyltransferase 73C4-like [Alnus glutinosa]
MPSGEILVVPKNGQGHLFPCMELCKHLISRNYTITLIVDSDITSSVPSSLLQSPLFQLTHISTGSGPSPPFHRNHQQMGHGIETLLAGRDPNSARPVCAILDHIMSKNQEVFSRFGVPTVVFITSGACWAAVQHAAWVVRPGDMIPGEVRVLPGLPEEMVLKYSDLKQRRHWLPPPAKEVEKGPPGGMKPPRGPPLPGEPAPWVEEVESSAAILINTCDDLERPFLDYVAKLTRKPVWGVGPLLPDQYWQSTDSLLRDREIRPRKANYTEDEIIEWLDQQPRGSVMYVSFGSEVGPTTEEYPELAGALEESTRSFIWVIQRKSGRGGTHSGQPGSGGVEAQEEYFPHGLDSKVGKRGLIIHGWAPQLLILSHPSTGGFVSHCGWNSTVEAIVRGVPFLAWPIRGDQYYNAMLVVSHLKVGTMVSEGYPADKVKKNDILHGIEKVLTDGDIRSQSEILRGQFEQGFPASSLASLDAFKDFINQKAA